MKNLAQITENQDIITKEYLVAGYEPLLPATPLDPDTKYLNGLKQWATIYTHPSTHPPSIIVQDTSNRFVTDAEKSTWNGKLNASSYTASDVLTKIKTVDGSDSEIDADLLDGNHASAFSLTTHDHNGTYQAADADLTAIAGLAGATGLLRKTAANIWSLDTSTYSLSTHTHENYAPIDSPTFTGTVSGITADMVGLGNVTNESKATMFTSPTFTGIVTGVTAAMVGLGNVTNESKATMFTNPTFTGVAKATGNTSYTTSQLRNVFLSTVPPTSGDGANGDIWMVYTA